MRSDGAGQGSKFRISIPLTRLENERDEAFRRDAPAAPVTRNCIVIVDDNIDAGEMMCTLMKSRRQHAVHNVSSGAGCALDSAGAASRFQLLDLATPEMDGHELTRHIRAEPWGKDLILVAVSGWGQQDHRRRACEAGFNRHVTKPADLVMLQTVLNDA